jgi:serine/threonine-protein kinase HipA
MVTSAFIKLWGKTVGAIAWDPREGFANFEYANQIDPEKLPIAPIKMPAKQIYGFPELRDSATFRGLPGMLADSLPDRYGNDLINIWLAQNGRPENSLNPVELLCFIGKRGMGAMEFEPTISPVVPSASLELTQLILYTQQLLDNKKQLLLNTEVGLRDVMIDVLKMGTSAGGARPKAIIAYNEKTGDIRSGQMLPDKGYEHWLIKFDGVRDTQFGATYGYGRVEIAYYKMAIDFGIQMMESRLVEEGNRAHFMTKRFDRVNGDLKVHVQTLCALQHYDYNKITSYSYEQLFQTMRTLRLTYAEAEQMYRRMVFNVLSRNCDDHTKNFAFMMTTDGVWKLAPAYDVCHSYRPGSDWVSQHSLSINGKRIDFNKEDLLKFAEQHSIRHAPRIIEEGLAMVNNWMKYAKEFNVSDDLAKAIDSTLVKALQM